MNSQGTDQPTESRQPPFNNCSVYRHRINRVQSLESFKISVDFVSDPYCGNIDPYQFARQFGKLYWQARRGRVQAGKDAMPSSCKDIRAALAQCLQESDCVMLYRNKPSDCLRSPLLETMPTKCQQLKTGYGQCKRGMVDMRKRFRGNQPIAVSTELEGEGGAPSGQLYAGKSAFGGTVKETSGNEPAEKDWREVENEKLRKETGA